MIWFIMRKAMADLNHFCILLFVFLLVKTFRMPTGIYDLNICSDEIKIILL